MLRRLTFHNISSQSSSLLRKNTNTTMVVSKQGIKFSFLMKHFNDCPLDMKTTDVVNNFIVPRTKSSQLSYCEYLAVNDKFVEGTVGPANLFISHAWEGKFHSLMDSVDQHLMQLDDGLSYEDTYVWVDIFSVNQHVVPNIVSTHLRTSIQEMIKSIGETLVIVENWKDPIPLRRGWCLWEIYCSHQSNVKFGFAMTTQKQIHFYYDCQENEIDLQSIIDSIDFEKSECSRIEDKQAITYAIQDSCGFEEVNLMGKRAVIDYYNKSLLSIRSYI